MTGVTGEGRHGRERSTRLSKQWLELSLGMHAVPRGLERLLQWGNWGVSIRNPSKDAHMLQLLKVQRQRILRLRTVWAM